MLRVYAGRRGLLKLRRRPRRVYRTGGEVLCDDQDVPRQLGADVTLDLVPYTAARNFYIQPHVVVPV